MMRAFLLLFAMTMAGESYGQPSEKGRVENFTFAESRIFPGTRRGVTVYIPADLDLRKPVCVYVQHDGLKNASAIPAVFDSLIAGNVIPAMVGVFMDPGSLHSYHENGRPRPNRSLEYDGLGDDQVRFILDELLPAVAAKYDLTFSDDANDRAIGGMSSGGIAAFNAAWERPDAFSKVYCNSGSFVAFRGGNEYPSMVRKTEPKPIRFFLTVGTHDMENAAGDWTLSNHQMDKALAFAGYDYRFKVMEGGHVVGYEKSFAEAMTFLWHDWPARVRPAAGAPRVQDIVLPGEGWQAVSEMRTLSGKPTFNSHGDVLFPIGKTVMRISPQGGVAVVLTTHRHRVRALAVGRSDELYILDERGHLIVRDPTGYSRRIAKGVGGDRMVARPDGGVYVAGSRAGMQLVLDDRKPIRQVIEVTDVSALALAPDHWQLAVAENYDHRVYNFVLSPDGELQHGKRFFWLHRNDEALGGGAVDLAYDREGHLVAATERGIQFCGDDGRTVGILAAPGRNLKYICFGGKDLDWIYAFCDEGIYVRKLRVHGVGAFTPWLRMRKTPL